jgi:polyvinyl alcohol dehydrogenase (cytochrome)
MPHTNRFGILTSLLIALACTTRATAADSQSEGGAIYSARCAACHDHPREQIPPKAVLSAKPHERIIEALTVGPMQPMATGLNSTQMDSLASYLNEDRPAQQSAIESPSLTANLCSTPPSQVKPGHGDWNGWSPDIENTRFQADPALTPAEIPRLKRKWVFAYPGAAALGPPSVIGGRVYVGTDGGSVLSLDATTGCTYWATKPGLFAKSAITVAPSKSGQLLAYFSGPNGTVHAVRAMDGTVVWTSRVDTNPQAATGESPKLYDGRIYSPIRSAEGSMGPRGDYPCCTVRGGLAAFDADVGTLAWRGYTITEEPKPFKKNSMGTQMFGPAGAGVWAPVTIDRKLHLAYVGSAESRTDLETDASDAIIAFDLSDGQRRWVMQATADDNWTQGCESTMPGPNCPAKIGPDADFASPVILKSLSGGQRVLLGAQKSGVVHALDPDANGRLLWRRDLAADAHIPKDVVLRDRDQFGVVFGMAADSSNLYVAIADPVKVRGHVPLGVYALSLKDGHIVWHTAGAAVPSCSWGVEGCTGAQRTAVTVIPGAVFAGSANGHMRAYAPSDGHVLWDFDTAQRFPAVNGVTAQGGSIEGAATVVAKGTVFVMSGYAGSYGGGLGNALIAFTVDGR